MEGFPLSGRLLEDASASSVPCTQTKVTSSPTIGLTLLCELSNMVSPAPGSDCAGSAKHEIPNIELQTLNPLEASQWQTLKDLVAETAQIAQSAGGKPASARMKGGRRRGRFRINNDATPE